ncbi:transmembrane channel-like protein 8 isoform X3 [Octodon degus]|uniref:Transmembrane channel-like protein 8 isoform X3 n=1 Tax=Octodon degus TaxID=10160 RepID=A0A6P6ECE7_OCTDE|nr:transmembrane channel-like protein 8 isoform X3 [Octodon degus]
MLHQWSAQSGQTPREPGHLPESEDLWEQEMEWLRASREPLRSLPYAMMDKRLIRKMREPEGMQMTRWQCWQQKQQTMGQRLGEVARRLAWGFGLWKGALYEIGGLFGSGIRSYFTFLRFLLLLNLLTVLLTASFVLVPLAWLHTQGPGPTLNFTALQCPGSHQAQTYIPRFHNQLWNVLTGRAFNNTYLFYGAYWAGPESSSAYSIRLAYLLCPLACLLLCFCGILRRMMKGFLRRPGLGQDYGVPLSAKVFSSWDFCIHLRDAATIKKHEISNEFKVYLEECRRRQQVQQDTPTQRACRLLSYLRVNLLNACLVAGGISAIFWATKYSQDNKEESLFVVLQYLPPGVISLVNFLGPLLFMFLVQLESYPPSIEVNLILIWCVVLKLASLGMFSFSLGQTMLCIGRNKTSCETYGYNACDYQAAGGAVLRPVLDLAGPGGVPGAQECAGHRGRADGHLDGPLLLPPAAPVPEHLSLPHLLHQEVHPPEELQDAPSALPRLQLHLLLPAGAAPGPAPGSSAPGLCGQQHPFLLGLWPLHQLLGPLASGPGTGSSAAPTFWPACPPVSQLSRLRFAPPLAAQPHPDSVHRSVPGQCKGHPRAPEAVGVASSGEVAPGGGAVAAATGARLERISDPRLPSFPSFTPAVFRSRILEPRFSGSREPRSGPFHTDPALVELLLPWIARFPGPPVPLSQRH